MKSIPSLYEKANLGLISPEISEVVKDDSCYIWGSVGTGKTFILFALAKYFYEDKRYGVIWTTFNDLLLRVRSSFVRKFEDSETESEIIDYYRKTDVLLIDDLSAMTDKESDFSLRVLMSILDYRIMYNKWTYFTSNRAPEELKTAFDDRVFSRIVGEFKIVKIVGKDRRIKQ